MYTLLNKDGFYESEEKGLFGGYKRMKIYGRLDCPSALWAIKKGDYAKYRVFFATEQDAIECGYRPCGNCMKEEYKIWKENKMSVLLDRNLL
jgi:methylphosphotriester-DNA--protein-cysteine methyltransferase